jgi:hypothetical protein
MCVTGLITLTDDDTEIDDNINLCNNTIYTSICLRVVRARVRVPLQDERLLMEDKLHHRIRMLMAAFLGQ